ncbi:GNAT family N-acetyltransferase [Neobacillus sp. GCM10023253]|uniref:GNAT family N-acetyltransferase n=1 Tax=Neobacillus sp. GCM10023253 TaxID=3252644 RepID=UPI00361B42F5
MKLESLRHDQLKDFVEYCKKHRKELDDSFLYDDDLAKFELNNENPTYIVADQQGEIVAAASLIIDEYQRRGKRARFRIFHSEIKDVEVYNMLMKALRKHTADIEKLFIFVPLGNQTLSKVMEELEFSVDRYVFLLVREDMDVPVLSLPKGYKIRDFKPGKDEEIWCEVRNAGFANLKGNETPVTPDMVEKLVESADYIDGGMKILFDKDIPVGVVRGAKDKYEGAPIMNIGPLAILPEYQGKGLGRLLLRTALQLAKEKAYQRTILSVNGENEQAKALYLQEGFEQVEGVACYQYDL